MSVKQEVLIYDGPLKSGSAGYLEGYPVPAGYSAFSRAVFLVKVTNAAGGSYVSMALTERTSDIGETGDAFLVADNVFSSTNGDEWRFVTDLPGLHYRFETGGDRTSAHVKIYAVFSD